MLYQIRNTNILSTSVLMGYCTTEIIPVRPLRLARIGISIAGIIFRPNFKVKSFGPPIQSDFKMCPSD